MNRIPCYDKEGNTIKSLIQWDKNQSVYIDDLENGSLPRVHFALGSNAKESKEYKDNVKFDGKKIKITIPNELLKTYAEMYLFLYYGDVESEEPLTTKYMVKIPITKKPQPDDYIYEDNVDYLSIYKLKLELSLILDNAANYASESRANKEAAETAAREAAGSAQEARNILSDVNAAGANQIQAIETAGAEQTDAAKAEIDAKGKQTLDSIPEDYTGLQTEVDDLKGDLDNHGKYVLGVENLINGVTYVEGSYINEYGVETALANSRHSTPIPIESNSIYTIVLIVNTVEGLQTGTLRIHGYKNGVWVKQVSYKGYNESCNDVLVFNTDDSFDSVVLSGLIIIEPIFLYKNKSISERIENLNTMVDNLNNKIGKSLSDIAIGDLSFKQLFEGSYNLVKTNYRYGTISPSTVNAGNPVLTDSVFASKPYSLKAFGTTSAQTKERIVLDGDKYYYFASMVKVERYVNGWAGALYGGNYVGFQRETDGFERASKIINLRSMTDSLFTGTWSSANADAYVDNVVLVDITSLFDGLNTISGKQYALYTMDNLFAEYIDILNTIMISKNESKYVGVILDAVSADGRFTAMNELYDIAYKIDTHDDYVPTDSDFISASKGVVCKLKTPSAMYQNYDFDILYSKDADVQTLPASTTKLVSLVTAMPYITSVMEKVTLTSDDIQSGSGDFFASGDVMTIEDLMLGMMLPSSNTCAMAFAHHIGKKILGNESASYSDCISAFVSEMNRKASLLGCINSSFDTPSGLSKTNKTTATDLLRFVVEACSYNEILRVWNKKNYDISVGGTNPRTVSLETTVTNASLENSYYIFGGKTGSLSYDDGTVARALVMVAEHK